MWTPPSTVAVGQIGTAALWNQQVRDNFLAIAPTGKLSYYMQAATAIENLIQGAWLELNGAAVSRTTYPSLWSLIGTTLAAAFSGTTTLNGAIIAGATSITITAWPSGFPSSGWPTDGRPILILVDTEKMLVTAGFGTTTLTVVRGVEGTVAAAHANAATVSTPSQSPFGAGDGSTTFTLPDAGGRSLVAAANGGHVDVAALGNTENTTKANRRPKHRHTVNRGSLRDLIAGTSITEPNSGTWTTTTAVPTVGADPTNDPLDAPAHAVLGVWAVKI